MTRRSQLTPERLLFLIDLAYAAGEDAAQWSPFLVELSDAIGATGALIMHHDLMAEGGVTAFARIDPDAVAAYNAYYHQFEPWPLSAPTRALSAHVGTAVHEEQILPHAEFRKLPFFHEFAKRYGTSRLLTSPLIRDPTTVTALSAFRAEGDEPFGAEETAFLNRLAPHAERAARLHRRLERLGVERDAGLTGIDALPCAVFLVDANAAVIFANRRGRAILERADSGLVTDGGCLRATSPLATNQLRRLCADASTRSLAGRDRALVLERPPQPALQVVAVPLTSSSPFNAPGQTRTALLFVSDPTDDEPPNEQLLQKFFGLTPAEAAVAASIVMGRTLDEIGFERRYTKQTVQWYSKQVLDKTGSRHRGELVRRISRMLASLLPDVTVRDEGET